MGLQLPRCRRLSPGGRPSPVRAPGQWTVLMSRPRCPRCPPALSATARMPSASAPWPPALCPQRAAPCGVGGGGPGCGCGGAERSSPGPGGRPGRSLLGEGKGTGTCLHGVGQAPLGPSCRHVPLGSGLRREAPDGPGLPCPRPSPPALPRPLCWVRGLGLPWRGAGRRVRWAGPAPGGLGQAQRPAPRGPGATLEGRGEGACAELPPAAPRDERSGFPCGAQHHGPARACARSPPPAQDRRAAGPPGAGLDTGPEGGRAQWSSRGTGRRVPCLALPPPAAGGRRDRCRDACPRPRWEEPLRSRGAVFSSSGGFFRAWGAPASASVRSASLEGPRGRQRRAGVGCGPVGPALAPVGARPL